MARPSQILRLQRLEDRTVPALFNVPWNAPQGVTLSFVPDGTAVDGTPSVLFQSFQQGGWSQGAWQGEILRAFQTWASQTNVGVAVTADGGQAIGASGAAQGDGRFGDVRISALPLPGDVLAMTTPPGQIDSHSGDIIINSNVQFVPGGAGGAAGYDLYSVVLQEAGHALGLPNSPDPDSPMYEQYQGVRGGLSTADVAAVQGLYGGPRQADGHEGAGNGDFASAAPLDRPTGTSATATLVAQADLSTSGDVDVYRVRTPASLPAGALTVTLSGRPAGLLVPQVSVYDAAQQLVGSAAAAGPAGGDVTVSIPGAQPNADYFIRVAAAAGTAFEVGGYRLRVVTDSASQETVSASPALADDARTNESAAQATTLTATQAGNPHYRATAVLRDAGDVDFYRIHAYDTTANDKTNLYLTVRADAAGLRPRVQVYNDQLQLQDARVLANADGTYAVLVKNVPTGRDYFVKTFADGAGAATSGGYALDVDCRSDYGYFNDQVSGELSAFRSYEYHRLTVGQTQVMRFTLTADDGRSHSPAGVRATIYNAQGEVVFTLMARAGDSATDTVLLEAGEYVVCIAAGTNDGSALLPVDYHLYRTTLSDPIGPTPVDSSGEQGPDGPTTSWSSVDSDEYDELLALFPILGPWI